MDQLDADVTVPQNTVSHNLLVEFKQSMPWSVTPYFFLLIGSIRSSNSHPDLLVTHQPLFQITPVLNTGLSLSEPLQLYKGYNAI